MLTQAEVYALFKEIDRLPGIMEPRLGRWRAWPLVKMQLVWQLMHPQNEVAAGRASWADKVTDRLRRYPSQLASAWRQAAAPRAGGDGGTVAILQVPRMHMFRDGKERDMIYGALLDAEQMCLPVVVLKHSWLGGSRARIQAPTIDLDPHRSVAEMHALWLMGTPRVRRAAAALDSILNQTELPLDVGVRCRQILLALGLFEARRRLFRRLFEKIRARILMVTYAPGRSGEIAAARELGIPVVELQHGMVSAHCPDYAWPASYRAMRAELAFPDRIWLFGPAFKRQIAQSGFWTDGEAVSVGAAAMDHYRPAAKNHIRRPGPLRLLFMTQATVRSAAIAFWTEFARTAAEGALEHEVVFKLHPEEGSQIDAYRVMAQEAEKRFRLLPLDANPFEAMLDADIVLAYNSMSLVEALALGRGAISLCGGSISNGLAGTFGLDELRPAMPHIRTQSQLRAVLCERAADEVRLSAWRQQAFAQGADFFAEGFLDVATKLANAMFLASGSCGRQRLTS